MAREINYVELSRTIRRYYAQHPNRVSINTFADYVKNYINKGEAKRLLLYYSDVEKVLVPSNKHFFRFNCHQDHFNPDAVRDIFLKTDIQTRFGKAPKANKVAKEFIKDKVNPIQSNEPKEPDYKKWSDADLEAYIGILLLEKEHRAKRKEQLSQINSVLKNMNMSKEELINLLKDA